MQILILLYIHWEVHFIEFKLLFMSAMIGDWIQMKWLDLFQNDPLYYFIQM